MAGMNLQHPHTLGPQSVLHQRTLHIVGRFAHTVAKPSFPPAILNTACFGGNVDQQFLPAAAPVIRTVSMLISSSDEDNVSSDRAGHCFFRCQSAVRQIIRQERGSDKPDLFSQGNVYILRCITGCSGCLFSFFPLFFIFCFFENSIVTQFRIRTEKSRNLSPVKPINDGKRRLFFRTIPKTFVRSVRALQKPCIAIIKPYAKQ